MKHTTRKIPTLAALVCAFTITAVHAQKYPIPGTAAEVPGPPPGTAMTRSYVETVGRMAYVWGWPLVNAANRAAAFSMVPAPGLPDGVVPVAYNRLTMLTGYMAPNQRFIGCPNQDVVYGAGFFDLDNEPTVFQVPDFGDRFWVYSGSHNKFPKR
jgi:hypothetical protein